MSAYRAIATLTTCALLGLSCERADAEQPVEVFFGGGAGGQAGGPSDSPTQGGEGGNAVLAGTGPQLLSNHSGFGIPTCFDCHGNSAPYPHIAEVYEPPNCVACHGYNGASHRDHAVAENPGCANCHQTVSHVTTFTVPKDCITCHHQS